jgi:cob(I)alamin adenosyltransferase
LITISQLQRDFFSYIEENQETILNLNCKLEEIQTEQIQVLENRINQLLERVEKLELYITNGTKDTNKKNTLENICEKMFRNH